MIYCTVYNSMRGDDVPAALTSDAEFRAMAIDDSFVLDDATGEDARWLRDNGFTPVEGCAGWFSWREDEDFTSYAHFEPYRPEVHGELLGEDDAEAEADADGESYAIAVDAHGEACAWRVLDGLITHATWMPSPDAASVGDFTHHDMGECDPPILLADCIKRGWTVIARD